MVAISEAKHVWEVKDRYGHAKAVRINQPTGQPTEFSMVYGKDDEGIWQPIRPVSDRYQPVSTALIVDAIRERFAAGEILTEDVRFGTRCTKQNINIVLDLHKVRIDGAPADAGTRFTEFGDSRFSDERSDLWRPTIRVGNAYDGTSAARVAAGWYRMICSNGLVIESWKGSGFTTMSIHTVNEIPAMLEKIGTFEFGVQNFKEVMGKLVKTPMTPKAIKALQDRLPKNYKKDLLEAPHENAYQAVNFLLYLQSHEMSIDRGKVLQPIINGFFKKAAA